MATPVILGLREVSQLLRRSKRSLHRIREGGFPEPLRLVGPRSHPTWRRVDVLRWIDEQASATRREGE